MSVFRGNNNGIESSIWALAGTPFIPVINSDLLQLGGIYNKSGLVIDLQIYQRNISGVSSRAADLETQQDSNPILGDSEVRGLDILLKKRYHKLRSWFSYSLSKTEMTFKKIQRESFLADHDQTHVFQWSNQLDINSFEFSIGYKFSSGTPYSIITSFDIIDPPGSGPDQIIGEYDGINLNRLKGVHDLNTSVAYNFNRLNEGWKGYLVFSISNLLDQKYVFNRSYSIDNRPNQMPNISRLDKIGLGITPNLSLRFEW